MDLLQNIDLDYYRMTRLLVVRAELAQLREAVQQPRVEATLRGYSVSSSPAPYVERLRDPRTYNGSHGAACF
jgi:hypothetical protein